MSGKLPGNYPTRIGPIVDAMATTGPQTMDQLTAQVPQTGRIARSVVRHWVKSGWLADLGDGRFGPGPKASLDRNQAPHNARHSKRRARDLSGVEGSDQNYALGQLAHGPMLERDLAALMDVPLGRAQETLRALARLGYVRKRMKGPWELLPRREAAE